MILTLSKENNKLLKNIIFTILTASNKEKADHA